MSKLTAAGVFGVVVLASTGAIGVAQAQDGSVSDSTTRVVVRHLVDRNPVNTDLDLGQPGFSVGDGQVFTSRVVESGRRVATSAGTSQIVGATFDGDDPRLITVSLTQTFTFDNGSLVMAGAFTEDVTVGPRPFTLAVTGGTGAYRTARGELLVEIIRGTNNSKGTLTLILGR